MVTLHYFLPSSLLNDNVKLESFNSPAATKYNFSFLPLPSSVLTSPIKLIYSGVTKRRIIWEGDEVNRHHAVPQDISCQVKGSFPFSLRCTLSFSCALTQVLMVVFGVSPNFCVFPFPRVLCFLPLEIPDSSVTRVYICVHQVSSFSPPCFPRINPKLQIVYYSTGSYERLLVILQSLKKVEYVFLFKCYWEIHTPYDSLFSHV